MSSAHNYLFLDLAVLTTAVTLTWGRPEWRRILSRQWLRGFVLLFVFWCAVDWIAIGLRIWSFPPGGSLPVRIAGLPLEEYFVFLVHAVLTTFVAELVDQ